MNETVYIIAGGFGLLLVGLGLGFWVAQLRTGKHVAKAADVQEQFDDYRQSVTEHFGRTAEHFQAIGQQYRELYEHMASGADTLIDPQAMDEKLSFKPTVMIEQAGANESGEVETLATEPVAVNDDHAAQVETDAAQPTETEIEDVEPAAKAGEDADDLQRIYH